jgi:putative endonuclease
MFYIYFLKSLKNNDIYIGSCQDVFIRLLRHNRGCVKSTKGYRPWKLIYYESVESRSEAVKKERFYKTIEQKTIIRNRFK